MRLLTSAEYRRVPWKNGLGSTLELASDAAAPGGEWTWRLSIADVPSRAEFSRFPGVDRFIACFSGPGLKLERSGAIFEVPGEGEALRFPGEELVAGVPLGPGVRDVNLMLRRDRWRGRMIVARERALALDAALVLVHAPTSTLVTSGSVAVSAAAVVVACELTPV